MKMFNRPETKEKRKDLRKEQTDAERKLWSQLRSKRMKGYKFYRQYGISSYIADFYSPSCKIVIEVDGGQHYSEDAKVYDNKRTEFFKTVGIKTMRFNNLDVLKNLGGVVEKIYNELPLAPSLIKRGNAPIRRRRISGQSTIEFTFVLIVILFLAYGMIRIFRWAGMDLAERRWANDKVMTDPKLSTEEQLAPDFYRPKRLNSVYGK